MLFLIMNEVISTEHVIELWVSGSQSERGTTLPHKAPPTDITNPKSHEREPSLKNSGLFLMVFCIGGPE